MEKDKGKTDGDDSGMIQGRPQLPKNGESKGRAAMKKILNYLIRKVFTI